MKVVDGLVRIENITQKPITLHKNEHFCQMLRTQTPYRIATTTTQEMNDNKSSNDMYSTEVSLDPDHVLLPTMQLEFTQLLRQYDSVFNPKYEGYNGSCGKFEAVVNMGPVLPPQRKGRVPQYSKDKLHDLQATFDKLEAAGVFKKPEDAGVVIEYLNPSFLINKPNGGHRLVTAFADVGEILQTIPLNHARC